jgi:hypothetical protein
MEAHRRFRCAYCLHNQGDECLLPLDYTALRLRELRTCTILKYFAITAYEKVTHVRKHSYPVSKCPKLQQSAGPSYRVPIQQSNTTASPCHGSSHYLLASHRGVSLSRPGGICGGPLGQVFFRVLRFPCQFHSTIAFHTHHVVMNNRYVRGRSSETQSHPYDMNMKTGNYERVSNGLL